MSKLRVTFRKIAHAGMVHPKICLMVWLVVAAFGGAALSYGQVCVVDDHRGFFVTGTCDYFPDDDCSANNQNGVCQFAECKVTGCFDGYDERCVLIYNL